VEDPEPTPSRRGRLPAAERSAREQAVLAAARAAIVDIGYHRVTMGDIARGARASKETLYAWFGSKEAIATALIAADADASAARVTAALRDPDTDAEGAASTMTSYAVGLLTLLTGPSSVALNRAAVTSPRLAEILLASGRHRIGPIVAEYLALLHDAGTIHAPDSDAAFELFYGLVVRDTQIRVLLGEPAPSRRAVRRRAEEAVEAFLTLTRPTGASHA
jgi:AcrR family transcriptional regulator